MTRLWPSFMIMIVTLPSSQATMTENFQLNQSFGKTLIQEAQSGVTSGSMPLEGMGKTAPLDESSLSPENVSRSLQESPMGQWILEQEKRPDKKHVTIDPTHDPLMESANGVIEDPLKVLKAEATIIEEKGDESEEEILCEESADPVELSCVETLGMTVQDGGQESHVVTVSVTGDYFWHYVPKALQIWSRGQGEILTYLSPDLSEVIRTKDPKKVSSRVISSPGLRFLPFSKPNQGFYEFGLESWASEKMPRTLKFEVTFPKDPIIKEQWVSGCGALEALSDDEGKGPCTLIEERCTKGPETRVINGVPVKRDCWEKKRFYLCGSSQRGTCGEPKVRGCTQTGSECIQKVGDHCLRWKQTYRCKKTGHKKTRMAIKGEGVPWCLDGRCYSPSWEANGDMLQAMSKMAVLAQIQKDMKDLNVFTGQGLQCRRACLGFQNCCGTERGWGLDIRFAACNEEEKLLSQKQSKGLCVFLGTYCSKKVLGQCVQKKSTSCCYESRIARIIQQAAHQQLGLSWGSPESPQCRGLTPEELSKLNLEKVDFRELYEEIMSRYKAPQVITPQKETLSKTKESLHKGTTLSQKEGL